MINLNESVFMSVYEIIKGWCKCGRIKNVEIVYHIDKKHLECNYDLGLYSNNFDNISVSNIRKLISLVKKEKLENIDIIKIVW